MSRKNIGTEKKPLFFSKSIELRRKLEISRNDNAPILSTLLLSRRRTTATEAPAALISLERAASAKAAILATASAATVTSTAATVATASAKEAVAFPMHVLRPYTRLSFTNHLFLRRRLFFSSSLFFMRSFRAPDSASSCSSFDALWTLLRSSFSSIWRPISSLILSDSAVHPPKA